MNILQGTQAANELSIANPHIMHIIFNNNCTATAQLSIPGYYYVINSGCFSKCKTLIKRATAGFNRVVFDYNNAATDHLIKNLKIEFENSFNELTIICLKSVEYIVC